MTNLMPSAAGSFSPGQLTKCPQSVSFEASAALLKRQSEPLAGRAKAPPKSQQCDASPDRLAGLRGVTPRLEGPFHRPGADRGAGSGSEVLQNEFPQIRRACRHSTAVVARSRGTAWALFRRRALPAAQWSPALPGQRPGVAGEAEDSSRWSEIVRPDVEAPRQAGRLRGADNRAIRAIDSADYREADSNRQTWWGQQSCTCRGAGSCLCCRRFDRAIRAHLARVVTAGGC